MCDALQRELASREVIGGWQDHERTSRHYGDLHAVVADARRAAVGVRSREVARAAAVTPTIQKILTIVGVDRIVPEFASIEAAPKDLGGNA